jgi:uncharacterized protein (UPF0335 family)
MATKNATARSQRTFENQFTNAIQIDSHGLYGPSQHPHRQEISKTLSWYQSRIEQLEKDQQQLNQHIEECYDYIEHQSEKARRLKAKLRKMHKRSEGVLDTQEWVSIPRSLVHKAIVFGLALYAFGLMWSMMI